MSTSVNAIIVDIPTLERESGLLPVYLQLVKQQTGHFQYSLYGAYLYVLVNGASSIGTKIQTKNNPVSVLIDETIIRRVWLLQSANPTLNRVLKINTPAGKMGLFDVAGDIGISCGVNPQTQYGNIVHGETHYLPPLIQHALQKVSYDFFDKMDVYLNQLRIQRFLSLPKSVFGNIQQVASALSNVVVSFERIIIDIYKGAMRAVQTFIAYINGLASQLQTYINNIIEQVIPADFMCLILQVLQFIIKDINFFTTLFANILSIENIQGYLNSYINQLGSGSIPLSPDIQNILNITHQFTSNPKAYVSHAVQNIVFISTLQAVKGDILKYAANNYTGNVSYAGPYLSTYLPDLMQSITKEIISSDNGRYNQCGISANDNQQTNRYAEKSIRIPTSFYTV